MKKPPQTSQKLFWQTLHRQQQLQHTHSRNIVEEGVRELAPSSFEIHFPAQSFLRGE